MWNTAAGALLALILLPVGIVIAILSIPFRLIAFIFTALFGPFSDRERTKHVNAGLAIERELRFLYLAGIERGAFWETPISYREVSIPKKTGGHRTLHIPSDDLKLLQRKIGKFVAKYHGDKVHGCANAYIQGRGVISNARPHIGCEVLIKLDLKNFFPSVPRANIAKWLKFKRVPLELDREAPNRLVERVLDIVCLEDGLPQGAPSSPLLSNLALFDLDRALAAFAKKHGAKYTRYADDLTFSYESEEKGTVRRTIDGVRQIVIRHGFELNEKKGKRKVLRRHQHQSVCGVTLNSGRLSITRKKRRQLRAAKHQLAKDGKAQLSVEQLRGWDAYIEMINRS